MGNDIPTRASAKMAMQAQQTKTASLSLVGGSDSSDEPPITSVSSEPLFCSGVPGGPFSIVSDAVASVVFE